jgi:hypothetical protein
VRDSAQTRTTHGRPANALFRKGMPPIVEVRIRHVDHVRGGCRPATV